MMKQIAEEMIDVAQALYAKNMLAAADGNISYRVSDQEILMTPSGKRKANLSWEDMAVIDLNNHVIKGLPSSERLMHLTIYQHCAKARCVVHAHPPHAIAWTIADSNVVELPGNYFSELILAAGRIPIAPYARPGTQAMADHLKPFLPECRIILLAHHGALSWGEDLQEALNGMERLEHAAEILFYARQLGPMTTLPPAEVDALYAMRKKIREKSL